MRHLPIFFALCCLAMTACSARPDEASIFVETTPPGAVCILSRDGQPLAKVEPTPGIAVVTPGTSDITVDCRRSGFRDASTVVHVRSSDPGFSDVLSGTVVHRDYENRAVLILLPQ